MDTLSYLDYEASRPFLCDDIPKPVTGHNEKASMGGRHSLHMTDVRLRDESKVLILEESVGKYREYEAQVRERKNRK